MIVPIKIYVADANYSTLSQRLCNIVGNKDCFPAPMDYPTDVCDLISMSCPLSSIKQYTEKFAISVPADHFDVGELVHRA